MMQKKVDSPATVVAIGDVHGCADLLEKALAPYLDSGAELIFLGDLIDRSPEPDGDRRVVEQVRQLQEQPDAYGLAGVTVLRGNHKQMVLDALQETDAGDDRELWAWNGGDPAFLPVVRDHQDWLETLPLTVIRGDHLFVHASVRPEVPLEEQQTDDLLWIRRPFLTRNHGLPYTVVHGHTFRSDYSITRLPHRIGIDTGGISERSSHGIAVGD